METYQKNSASFEMFLFKNVIKKSFAMKINTNAINFDFAPAKLYGVIRTKVPYINSRDR